MSAVFRLLSDLPVHSEESRDWACKSHHHGVASIGNVEENAGRRYKTAVPGRRYNGGGCG